MALYARSSAGGRGLGKDYLRSYRFQVEILPYDSNSVSIRASSVSGIGSRSDLIEIPQIHTDFIAYIPEKHKYSPIKISQALLVVPEEVTDLEAWRVSAVNNQNNVTDVRIRSYGKDQQSRRKFLFKRCYPTGIEYSEMDGRSSGIVIASLEFVYSEMIVEDALSKPEIKQLGLKARL